MNKVGIIAAMKEEKDAIFNIMTNIRKTLCYNKVFIEGTIQGKKCILVEAGVGKVNAASTTQIMIEKFEVEGIINVGSAGALNEDLHYGDIVISSGLVQHDFDITCFNHPKGYIPEIGTIIKADDNLITIFEKVIPLIGENITVKKGIIATGDQFYNDPEIKRQIRKEFNAECDEMEGAAVAQVCTICNIPFIVIRSISDKPKNKEKVDFYDYLKMASERCALMVLEAMKEI